MQSLDLTDHVVICNVNAKVPAIVEELRHAKCRMDVVLIVQDDDLWSNHPQWHPEAGEHMRVYALPGHPSDQNILRQAAIENARAAVILADPLHGAYTDARSVLVALAVEHLNPDIHTVMELMLSVNRCHLRRTVVNEVICLGEIAEKLIAQASITPGVSRLFYHLLTTESPTSDLYTVPVPPALEGWSYRQLARRAIERRARYVLCGYVCNRRDERGQRQARIALNPPAAGSFNRDRPLQIGDQVIVMAQKVPLLSDLATPPQTASEEVPRPAAEEARESL